MFFDFEMNNVFFLKVIFAISFFYVGGLECFYRISSAKVAYKNQLKTLFRVEDFYLDNAIEANVCNSDSKLVLAWKEGVVSKRLEFLKSDVDNFYVEVFFYEQSKLVVSCSLNLQSDFVDQKDSAFLFFSRNLNIYLPARAFILMLINKFNEKKFQFWKNLCFSSAHDSLSNRSSCLGEKDCLLGKDCVVENGKKVDEVDFLSDKISDNKFFYEKFSDPGSIIFVFYVTVLSEQGACGAA